MRHARVQFETTKNHLGKQITLKTGSGSSQKMCGRRMEEDGGGGWTTTHTHQIFEALYTISPGGQLDYTFCTQSGPARSAFRS